jgi:hypothetical protein
MTIDAIADYARIPAILSFPDTTGFAETYGFGAASGRVWLEGQYLVPSEGVAEDALSVHAPLLDPAFAANAGGARRRRLARLVRREPLSEKR